MKKIVLDQFGEAWGYADVENSIREIDVFAEKTVDGTPVNIRTRKVSSAKKYEKQLQQQGGFEVFTKYEHCGHVYYEYEGPLGL